MPKNAKDDAPHILLVNPWIHDFAAYDFWAKPYGLLSLAAWLRDRGLTVSYIDCLDRFHPGLPAPDAVLRHGRGPYFKTPMAHPRGLEDIPRNYSRYGIPPQLLQADLASLKRPPDLILITSIMTYWYPGVFETIAAVKAAFPAVPLLLGGIYARLWPEHARQYSGADQVITDRGEMLSELIRRYTGFAISVPIDPDNLDSLPFPAFDLQRRVTYVPLLTRRGCPFDCAYCASRHLEPRMCSRSPQNVLDEIDYWHRRYGVVDFAFYDDALLVDAQTHAWPLLEGIIRQGRNCHFHTPNALHIRCIDRTTAQLMFRAGFHTLRLGLETTAFDQRDTLDRKVTAAEFERAVGHLKAAGFSTDRIGAYLLVGLPGQTIAGIEDSIDTVKAAGVTPVLAHYTPMPRTALWEEAVAASRYDLKSDPIFCNNVVFPCRREGFTWETISLLKKRAQHKPQGRAGARRAC